MIDEKHGPADPVDSCGLGGISFFPRTPSQLGLQQPCERDGRSQGRTVGRTTFDAKHASAAPVQQFLGRN